MGTVIPLGHFTRASRMRLGSRIRDIIGRTSDHSKPDAIHAMNVQIGQLIHTESSLLYEQAEMSEQIKLAPWLHIIGKLAEEQAKDFGSVEMRNGLRGCVEEYIASLQSAQITA